MNLIVAHSMIQVYFMMNTIFVRILPTIGFVCTTTTAVWASMIQHQRTQSDSLILVYSLALVYSMMLVYSIMLAPSMIQVYSTMTTILTSLFTMFDFSLYCYHSGWGLHDAAAENTEWLWSSLWCGKIYKCGWWLVVYWKYKTLQSMIMKK